MITLYTTHCPQCEVLQAKLNSKNIEYQIIEDVKEMRKLGFLSAPMLQVNDEIMPFAAAVKWVNGQGE
jgi:glutaredoxin-related protein